MTKEQYRKIIETASSDRLKENDLFYYILGIKICALTEYDQAFYDELTALQKSLYKGMYEDDEV